MAIEKSKTRGSNKQNFTTTGMIGVILLLLLSTDPVSATVENCLDERGGRCYVCDSGFSANNLGTKCIDNTTKNCAIYLDDQGTQCAICHCGYSLISSGLCVKAAIANCAFQDTAGTKCLLCRSKSDGIYGGGQTDYGASFDKKSCIDNTTTKNYNCVQYAEGDLMCNKCGKGYLPNAAGTCTALKTPDLWKNHCHTVDDKGEKCVKCEVGFNLDLKDSAFVPSNPCTQDTNYDLNCLRYPLGFDKVTFDFTQCLQCKWGYFLTDQKRCNTVNRYTGCTGSAKALNILDTSDTCVQGGSTNYPTLPTDCILFVELTYDSSTKVHKCLERRPASVANDCANLDPSTQQCATSNDCLTNKSFDSQYKTCQTSKIEGCLITNGLAWCEVCLNGYSLREGRCFLNPAYNPNCKTWGADGCTECNQGYGTAPQCTGAPSIARCTIMNQGKCVRCADRGYQLKADGTECQIQLGGVPFCAEHESDGVCQTCYETFTLSPDKKSCWKKMRNCRTLSGQNVCQKCDRFDQALRLYPDQSYSCVSMTTAGSYCDITMDGKSCETCKTHPSVSTTPNKDGDFLCTASAAIMAGCLQFNDASSCKTCEWDYIKTTDNKCYSLSQYRNMVAFQSSQWYDLEPCVEASNVNTCTKCDPTKDAGLLTFAAQSMGLNSQVEMIAGGVMCVDNNRNHLANSAQNNVQNCIAYADHTDLGACTTCRENYTKGGSAPNTCTNAKDPSNRCETMGASGCTQCRLPNLYPRLIDGVCFSADEAVKACQTFVSGSTSQCSECHSTHFLNPETQTCISYYLTVLDSFGNSNCQTLTQDTTTNELLCSKCSLGYTLQSTTYTVNAVTNQKAICVPDKDQWTSCVQFRTNGFCHSCQTGMKLQGSYDTDQLMVQTCFNEVANCIQYELNTYSYCITCKTPMAPDAYGWACVTEHTAIPRCLAHNRSDPTKCAICQDGFEAPDCKGLDYCYEANKDINGKALNSCNVCISGYIRTVDGKCVLQRVDNCDVAYDSFLCAQCKDGYNLIMNPDHQVSSWYSYCDIVQSKGCAYADDKGNCLKCIYGEYGKVDDICVQNDGTPQYPLYCASYSYNTELQQFQCSKCQPGFGLNESQTYCLYNNQPCGQEGCYQYDQIASFDAPAQCSSYSYTSILGVFSAILLSLVLAI